MHTVFLSSTSKDLDAYCAELARALNALKGWHCVWMEDFYASNTASTEYCRERVKECDVYVGVICPLYRSSPNGSKISFTQDEYEAAVARKGQALGQASAHFSDGRKLLRTGESHRALHKAKGATEIPAKAGRGVHG